MMQPFSNTVIGEIEQGEPAAPGVLLLEREREGKGGGKSLRDRNLSPILVQKSRREKHCNPLQWLWTDADGTRLLISQQTRCLRAQEMRDS